MGFSVTVLKWDQNISDFNAEDYSLHELDDNRYEHDISVKRVHSLKLLNPFYKRKLYHWIKQKL